MLRGDNYTYWKDILEIPLFFLAILSVALVFWGIPAVFAFAAIAIYIAIQFPMAMKICLRTKKWEYLYLVWVGFLRGFSRAAGLTIGLLNCLQAKR